MREGIEFEWVAVKSDGRSGLSGPMQSGDRSWQLKEKRGGEGRVIISISRKLRARTRQSAQCRLASRRQSPLSTRMPLHSLAEGSSHVIPTIGVSRHGEEWREREK